jgi:hypothetical protein
VTKVAPHKYQILTAYAKNVNTLRELAVKEAAVPTETSGTVIAHNTALEVIDNSEHANKGKAKGRKRRKKGL